MILPLDALQVLAHVPNTRGREIRAGEFIVVGGDATDTTRLREGLAEHHPGVVLIAEDSPNHAALLRILKEPTTEGSPTALLGMMSTLSAGVPPMPGERNLFRRPTRDAKPPAEVQAAIMSKAEARRERVKARNLRNTGARLLRNDPELKGASGGRVKPVTPRSAT